MENNLVSTFPAPVCWENRYRYKKMSQGLFEYLSDSSMLAYSPSSSGVTPLVDYLTDVWMNTTPQKTQEYVRWKLRGSSRPSRHTGPFITAPCDGVIQELSVFAKHDRIITFLEAQTMAQIKFQQELKLLYSRDQIGRFKLQHSINQLTCQEST